MKRTVKAEGTAKVEPTKGSASTFEGVTTIEETKPVRNINTGKEISKEFQPKKAPIAQTSKEAKELLKKAAKAEKKPAEKKEPRITLASKLDSILTKGGKWENLIAKANAASKELGATTKFNIGVLKGHIKYRTDKNAAYLGKLKMTEVGISV
jgi:hypothetical protein